MDMNSKIEITPPVIKGKPRAVYAVDGLSAYELAVKHGYEGTEEEWLNNIVRGEPGKTPVKGIDYFDGEDGYTPVKGVDYFDGKDGEDGKTPVKGVDYFDGKDGEDGKDGIDGSVFYNDEIPFNEDNPTLGIAYTVNPASYPLTDFSIYKKGNVYARQWNNTAGTVRKGTALFRYEESLGSGFYSFTLIFLILDGNVVDGVGIESIVTVKSDESGGENEVTINLTNGTSKTFKVKNGKQGAKGDKGEGFNIAKTYSSVQAMYDDWAAGGLPLYAFVLINTDDITDPDNAKLYVKTESGYSFLTDLSGAQGIQGNKGDKGDTGDDGVGIASVVQTTASDESGGTNIVTVTLTDGTPSTFEVINGKDGYTPVKGVDYFDGEDGYTPVKGVDYFDGKDGTSVNILGSFDSAFKLPISGNTKGDGYLVNGRLFVWDGSHWVDAGNIKGPAGADGISITSASINAAGQLVLTRSDGTTITAGKVVGEKGDKGDDGVLTTEQEALLTKLSNWYNEEHYVPISITKFTNSLSGSYEKGSTVTGVVKLDWAFNRKPMAVVCNNSVRAVNSSGEVISSATYSSDKTWTLKATGENGETSEKTTGIYFCNAVYYGVSDSSVYDSTLIKSLTKQLNNGHLSAFEAAAGEGQYIYYCVPRSFADVKFYLDGLNFAGGFSKVAEGISYTNGTYTTTYCIYRSDNSSLGNTSVRISTS